jgi:hypothetical protein
MPRPTAHAHPQFTAKQSYEPLRSARCVLDRRFEALCVEGSAPDAGGVPDRECEHRLRIRKVTIALVRAFLDKSR